MARSGMAQSETAPSNSIAVKSGGDQPANQTGAEKPVCPICTERRGEKVFLDRVLKRAISDRYECPTEDCRFVRDVAVPINHQPLPCPRCSEPKQSVFCVVQELPLSDERRFYLRKMVCPNPGCDFSLHVQRGARSARS
jgi:hypothetical protein